MRDFNYGLNLDKLKVSDKEREDFAKANHEQYKFVFEQMVHMGIQSRYSGGIGGSKQRVFGRILDKLDLAETLIIKLEETEYEFLKEILNDENSKFASQNTRLIMQYRQALEDAKVIE